MPDTYQLELTLPPHNNQNLFSDHYLNEILPSRVQWTALLPAAQQAFDDICGVFSAFTPSDNERQTEENLVLPVLKLLGHTTEFQPSLRTPEGVKTPDYVFYRDQQDLTANKNQILTDALPQQGGIAVGDAKYWNRPLDIAIRQRTNDALSNKNPAYQIFYYIQHSGVTWGILTNGKQWRLYHKDTAHKLDHFYEVDLGELVTSGDIQRFLYFYAFFRREAFNDGPLSIADILRESADYAHNVGNTLKVQVYDALRHIAQGFLDYAPNQLQQDPDTLKTIYDNSLILLYRLIFILYAEARELLPVRESRQYRDSYSLHSIKREVAQHFTYGITLLPDSALLWPRLQQLFNIINLGSPPLKVATFNGGLFDPQKHDFLSSYTVGDAHLQAAIDMLARISGDFVDYRDLSVRHMGTIYEGLLEYRIQPISIPEEGWMIELVNDKGERKATGSYYTPDYIVKYIVEQTVGPVLDKAVQGKESDSDKLQSILTVNVLDPAMGSGHFLVEATEYIARFLVDLALLPEGKTPEEADLAYWKRRVVQSCIYGVDLNPLAVELAKLSLWLTTVAKDRPLSFLDHHLRPGNSLVGARLENLQITAPARNNRGKKKVEEAQAAGQVTLFTDSDFKQRVSTAVSSMWLIEGNEAVSVDQVKEQERLYAELRKLLVGKYSRLLNLLTASHFGMDIDPRLRPQIVNYVALNNAASVPAFEKYLKQSDDIAERERFFHWELEFPEVYFDEHGRPLGDEGGFEAVVGNPPYVRQQQLAAYKPYFAEDYSHVYHGAADLSVYFLAQGIRQLQKQGLLAFISSGTFKKLDSGAPLRKYLSKQTTMVTLVDFGDQQVFDDALTYPVILVISNRTPQLGDTFALGRSSSPESVSQVYSSIALPQDERPWVFVSANLCHILYGWDDSKPLKDFTGQCVYRGVTTGYNDAFVISQDERDNLVKKDSESSAVIKPYVRGEDLHPWYQEQQRQWLIFTRRGIDIDDYPSVKHHLAKHQSSLEPEPQHWSSAAEWPGRKAGNYRWYEIQDTVAYYQVFEQVRIHSTKVSLYPSFSLLEPTCYAANTSYVIPVPDLQTGYYLLGLLNSHVSEFFCRSVFSPKANGYYEVQPGQLEQFPVPHADSSIFDAVAALAKQLTNLSGQRYALHTRVRHRIQSDLGTPGKKLNQKLTTWWNLDFTTLRAELMKVFKAEIPVHERDDWERWFNQQREEHCRFTDQIVQLETELNDRVYKLFNLDPDEIKLVEESTKYKYGEV